MNINENYNDTQKKILNVAIKLINKKGFNEVTINEICKCSEISKHTFYYYFKSKDDLLESFFVIKREFTNTLIEKLIDTTNNFEKYWLLMEDIIDFFVNLGIEITKQIFIFNLQKKIETFNPDIEKNKKFLKLELSFIILAQKNNEIQNKSNPEKLVKLNRALNMGIIYHWCLKEGSFDLKKVLRENTEILFNFKK